jgi:hypothetical protein
MFFENSLENQIGSQGKMTDDTHGDSWLKKMVHFVWQVQDIVIRAVSNQAGFAT